MSASVRAIRVLLVMIAAATAAISTTPAARAESYQRISGEGSSWAGNAIDAMRVNVKQFGITVDYASTGSTAGRLSFLRGNVDFAASDIPFRFAPEDGSEPERPERGSYAYMPITAGGTAFMYNLKISGQRVTNLRLSGENVAKIFTGVITSWDDPALAADNPGLTLPGRKIVPIVRADASGSTAQFTRWMIHQHQGLWADFCARSGRAPACGMTDIYPTVSGMIAQSYDIGIQKYVSQSQAEGSIGYVNYSYALEVEFPVAKVLNRAGYYTEPTPENVAVSLLQADINKDESSDDYLTQQLDRVYTDGDPRNYQLSSYSYLILPTKVRGTFDEGKGRTLGAFSYYAMCQAQQQSASLGYSPMPVNLVEASFEQIRKIPGVVVQDVDISKCKNPTFSPDGTNLLATNAPMPEECDRQGPTQCTSGTGGARSHTTAAKTTKAAAQQAGATARDSSVGPAGPAAAGPQAGGRVGSAAGDARGATPTTQVACDADVGGCTSGDIGVLADPTEGDTELAVASSTVLDRAPGWSATQTLIVLVSFFTLVLVLAPAVVARYVSRGRA